MTLCLVTGGSGFLGVRLVRALLEQGKAVRVFDLARSPELPPSAEFFSGDVRRGESLIQAARGAEIVFHLVGLMPQARASDEIMQAVNVEGTRNALEAAVAAKARRFVFLSSMEVYGYPERSPFIEDHPLRPIGTYGRNKVEAEALCIQYWKEHGLETVSLRPSTLVGPGINEPTFVMLLKQLQNPPLLMPLPGGGQSRFQMTAVSDCVAACWLAAEQPGAAGEAFNIGAENTLSMRDQAAALLERLGKPRPRFVSVPAGLAKKALRLLYRLGLSRLEPDHFNLMDTDMVMDCEKAKRLLGFVPRQTNLDMILESYEFVVKEMKKEKGDG
jgi:dTDP-glucose 4,6-dehydratase